MVLQLKQYVRKLQEDMTKLARKMKKAASPYLQHRTEYNAQWAKSYLFGSLNLATDALQLYQKFGVNSGLVVKLLLLRAECGLILVSKLTTIFIDICLWHIRKWHYFVLLVVGRDVRGQWPLILLLIWSEICKCVFWVHILLLLIPTLWYIVWYLTVLSFIWHQTGEKRRSCWAVRLKKKHICIFISRCAIRCLIIWILWRKRLVRFVKYMTLISWTTNLLRKPANTPINWTREFEQRSGIGIRFTFYGWILLLPVETFNLKDLFSNIELIQLIEKASLPNFKDRM